MVAAGNLEERLRNMDYLASMSWETALVFRVLIGFGLCQGFLIKYVSQHQEGQRTTRFLLLFIWTFLIACATAICNPQQIHFNAWFAAYVLLGAIGAFGTLFQWKAVAISQTRNSLFTYWDDVIAMTLAVLILGEASFITPMIAGGIAVSFVSLALFIAHDWWQKRRAGNNGTGTVPMKFYGYVLTYSLMWGVSYFGQRFWAHEALPIAGFLLAWYTGTLITAVLLRVFYHEEVPAGTKSLTYRGVLWTAVLAAALFASMAFTIAAYKAPQVVIQPIFFVSEMALPLLLGLLLFKSERKQFCPIKFVYLAIGIAGSLMVGFGFHQ